MLNKDPFLLTVLVLCTLASEKIEIGSKIRNASDRIMPIHHRIDTLESEIDRLDINSSFTAKTKMNIGETRFGDICWVTETTTVWDQCAGGTEFMIEEGIKIESFNTPRYLGSGKVLIQYKLHSDQEVIRWMNQSETVYVEQQPIRKR